jgi:hypothetical protein
MTAAGVAGGRRLWQLIGLALEVSPMCLIPGACNFRERRCRGG